ncbi:MAG: hypothetical protein AB7N65_02390 [Vicinamibacterales bacterium]
MTTTRSFSLGLYLVIVFAFSWPFQLAFIILGDRFRPILLVSMIMAGIGTFVAGRDVFRDRFGDAGWRWGRPRHYVFAFGLALSLWLLPVVIENVSGLGALLLWKVPWNTPSPGRRTGSVSGSRR